MARLIQIGSTFRPDDLLCGIGFCAGSLRFRLTARVLDRRSFFRAHGASRPATRGFNLNLVPRACESSCDSARRGRQRSRPRARCSAPRNPPTGHRGVAHEPGPPGSRGPGGSPYRLLYRPSDDRATSRRRAGTVAQGTRYRRIHAPDACLSRAAAAPRAGS